MMLIYIFSPLEISSSGCRHFIFLFPAILYQFIMPTGHLISYQQCCCVPTLLLSPDDSILRLAASSYWQLWCCSSSCWWFWKQNQFQFKVHPVISWISTFCSLDLEQYTRSLLSMTPWCSCHILIFSRVPCFISICCSCEETFNVDFSFKVLRALGSKDMSHFTIFCSSRTYSLA